MLYNKPHAYNALVGVDIHFLSVTLLKLLLLFGFADYSIVSQKQAAIM